MFRCITKCGRVFDGYYLTFAAAQNAAESFELRCDAIVKIEVSTTDGWVAADPIMGGV